MVFYRKYRPQKIDELDSQLVREKLGSVLSSKEIPHAFLFTGPKGLGKTSAARIVAKVVNCTNRKKGSVEPCNKCVQCVSITNGTNMDVLEIDGASNRGIDEIRDLREKVRLSPSSATKKVYIIDEVHMLTTEAFNALLKTLEEPPSHVLFVLATTEPHKVPSTILSRCFHIAFQKASSTELVRSFTRIAKGEGLNADKEALQYIASLSDGAFRDGAKILEEIGLSAGRKKITKELVEQEYKVSGITHYVSDMLDVFSSKDAKKGIQLILKMNEDGLDIKYFTEQLLEALHEALLFKLEVQSAPGYQLPATSLTVEDIKKLVRLFSIAYIDLKYSVIPSLPLELAVVEWCDDDSSKFKVQNSKSEPASEQPKKSPSQSSDVWNNFIDEVKKHNHSVAGVLRGCSLEQLEKGNMTIATKFKFHKERLDHQIKLLEETAETVFGRKTRILVELRSN